jgi:hypothetical protein
VGGLPDFVVREFENVAQRFNVSARRERTCPDPLVYLRRRASVDPVTPKLQVRTYRDSIGENVK